ncbi:MAG: Mbeg1-like protein [Paracoccaceae bacterium]
MPLDKLDYAILALDSYNQGYDPDVNHGETTIGSMVKLVESDISSGSDEVNANFYAVAYQDSPNNIVISYRGTDNPLGNLSTDWVTGAGYLSAQAKLAAEFYYQVKAAYPDATITLTGHSLGGGLAGLAAKLTG